MRTVGRWKKCVCLYVCEGVLWCDTASELVSLSNWWFFLKSARRNDGRVGMAVLFSWVAWCIVMRYSVRRMLCAVTVLPKSQKFYSSNRLVMAITTSLSSPNWTLLFEQRIPYNNNKLINIILKFQMEYTNEYVIHVMHVIMYVYMLDVRQIYECKTQRAFKWYKNRNPFVSLCFVHFTE